MIFSSKPTQAYPSAAPRAELQISENKSYPLHLQTHQLNWVCTIPRGCLITRRSENGDA